MFKLLNVAKMNTLFLNASFIYSFCIYFLINKLISLYGLKRNNFIQL